LQWINPGLQNRKQKMTIKVNAFEVLSISLTTEGLVVFIFLGEAGDFS